MFTSKNLIKLYRFVSVLGGALIVLMSVLPFINATGRTLFNMPLQGQVEITQLAMIYVVFLGFAYGLKQDQHVQMNYLYNKLGDRGKQISQLFTSLVGFFFMLLCSYMTWEFFWDSFVIQETMRAPITLPAWLAKFALPLSFLLVAIEFGYRVISQVASLKGGE